jgi:hypothetical protein
MTIKIYVGDIDETLATTAVANDPTAFLIDSNNYKEFLNKTFALHQICLNKSLAAHIKPF